MDTKNIVLTGLFCLSGCSVTSSTLNQTIDIKMAQDKYNQALANHIQVTVMKRPLSSRNLGKTFSSV